MTISTYLELKTAIQDWSKRKDSLSMIDNFIDLAESDIWVNLNVRDMEVRATAAAPTSGRFMALPDGFLIMRRLKMVSGSDYFDLEYRAPDSLIIQNTAGRPATFTVTRELVFDRTPDSAYTTEMQYYRSLTPLSASNSTNAVLTRFPTVYLYGALFHFAQWAHDDLLLQKYSQLFDEAIKRANKIDRRGRHGPSPAMRIEGSTP